MPQLSIQDHEGKTTFVPLDDGALTIGRADDNDICLTEPNVSRHHGKVSVQNGRVRYEEVSATWGTRLNSLLMREAGELQLGDILQIGDYTLELVGDHAQRVDTALVDDGRPAHRGSESDGFEPQTVQQATGDLRPPVSNDTAVVDLGRIQAGVAAPAGATEALNAADQPSLVAQGGPLAGARFSIGSTPCVVGRIAESADLVIDHRSISKEHARLTRRPDGSWEVLDLASSNGIRVNGEPYSKCVVSHGDVIEFGHVGLTFVGPGLAPPSGGSNKGLIIGVLVLLVLGGVLAAMLTGGNDGPAPEREEPAGAEAPGGEEQAAPTDAAVTPPDELLRKIASLRKAALYAEALTIARRCKEQHPGNARCALTVTQLALESEVNRKVTTLRRRLEDGDPKPVLDEVSDLQTSVGERLDEESPVREDLGRLRKAAQARVLAKLLADAEQALVRKRCREATDLAEQALAYDDANVDAMKIVRRCEAARAARKKAADEEANAQPAATPEAKPAVAKAPAAKPEPKPEPKREPKPRARPTPKPEPKPTPKPEPKAKPEPKPEPKPAPPVATAKSGRDLYKEARKAVLGGNRAQAIKLFEQAAGKGYAKAHGKLASLYYQDGNKAKCRKSASAYLQRYPDAGDAPQMQGLLDKCK